MTYQGGFFTPLLLLASTLGMPACFVISSESDPPERASLERKEGCAKTSCDVARDECHEDIEDCNDTCIGDIASFSSCYAVCRSIECPLCDGDEPCVEPSYDFSITGKADSVVEEACQDAVSRDQRCGETQINPDCKLAARLERREAATAYECLAHLACGADPTDCFEKLPQQNFGFLLCRSIQQVCPDPCPQDFAAAWDELGGWYRDDVDAAALDCFEEGCDEGLACFESWSQTVLGREPSASDDT